MKRLLLILLLIASCSAQEVVTARRRASSSPTPSFVQSTSFVSGSNPTLHAYTSSVTAGNCLVVGVGWYDTSNVVASVVGSLNGAFTQAQTSGTGEGAGFNTAIWYKAAGSSGSETVTVTFTTTGGGTNTNGETLHLYEFTGTSCTLDASNGQNDSTTGTQANPDSGSFTTTAPNDLIVGMIIKSGNQPSGANGLSDTILTTQNWYEVSGYRIQPTGTSTNAAWTSAGANPYAATGVGFK